MALSRNARKAIARKQRLDKQEKRNQRGEYIVAEARLAHNRKIIAANVWELRNTDNHKPLTSQGVGPKGYNSEAHCYAMRKR